MKKVIEKVGCSGCPNYTQCTKAEVDRPYCCWYVNRPRPTETERIKWYTQKCIDFGEHLHEA